jgi:Bacterial capsule synthesis protein PGA_cap
VAVAAGLIVAGAVVAVHTAEGSAPSSAAAASPRPHAKPSALRGTGAPASAKLRTTPKTLAPAPVTISVVGDTELGNTPLLPPDPATYLAPVRAALAAPIVFGNLEGTLTDSSGSKCGPGSTECFAFRTPPMYAQYLRHDGFTILNSANNHSHDFGEQGLLDTSAALKAAGIAQTGLPGQIGIVHAGSTSVAFVGFAPYTNTNDLLNFAAAKALIQKARSEADIVVVYMHAGAEGSQADHVTGQEEYYVGEDRGNPEAFAHAAINDGANMVIASGPHVLRGMEFYKGDLVDYSMGNFAGYGNFATDGDLSLSGILKVTLDGHGHFVSGSFVSITLDSNDQPSLDASGAAARFVAQLSSEDFGAASAELSSTGVITPHRPTP